LNIRQIVTRKPVWTRIEEEEEERMMQDDVEEC